MKDVIMIEKVRPIAKEGTLAAVRFSGGLSFVITLPYTFHRGER